MRKIILILTSVAFIISMNACFFMLATEKCDKALMSAWQWSSIAVFFGVMQSLVFDCRMSTRIEKLMLIVASSLPYYTIFIIIITKLGWLVNPYNSIINYNSTILIIFIVITISAFYSGTFKIGYKLRSRRRV